MLHLVGLAVTSPLSASAMVDQLRWQVVIYADTPKCLVHYHDVMSQRRGEKDRKLAVFVLGAHHLNKVFKDQSKYHSVLVFDDIQNLHLLVDQVDNFTIVDVDLNEQGALVPKHMTPQDINDALTKHTVSVDAGLFVRVAATLSKRPASVLETTNRMPATEKRLPSGIQGHMVALKDAMDANPDDNKVLFSVAVDYLCKLTFGMVERASVTANVTKKLSAEAKPHWQAALEIVSSPIGEQMGRAYRQLCTTTDPAMGIGHAVRDFDLVAHGGDFAYLTALLPPFREAKFVVDFGPPPSNFAGVVPVSAGASPAKKPRQKKARGHG